VHRVYKVLSARRAFRALLGFKAQSELLARRAFKVLLVHKAFREL
jgi:hypothetical protein